ncbi:hypothetical protein APHAL10511_005963 [Amanita phalloides]|nr:hypothetical protein APHAL10511_005963 [Amanita phalloides]
MTQPIHAILTQQLLSDFDDDDDDRFSTSSILTPSAIATSVTSYDVSMRSASPVPSVMSITSLLREQMIRQEHGRGLNNYSEVYCLPADEQEWDRLKKQYSFMSDMMGKYPPPLHDIMRDDGLGGEVKRCLDLGCGNGSWIMDLARDYPHCEAVAVDLVPMQSSSMPPNVRSEVDDINLGLEHFYGDFNVVHAWLISSGIKDYERLIDQISHVLRPGGLIDVMEWDFYIYDANRNRIEASMDQFAPPWLPRFVSLVTSAIRNRGGDIDGPEVMETLIQNHPSFENVVCRSFWVPASPWQNLQEDSHVDTKNFSIMRENVFEFLKSAAPLLLSTGLQPEQFEILQNNARQELADGALYLARMKRVYAVKRH